MASSGKGKGPVRPVEWRKRDQNKVVRQDGKKQIHDETKRRKENLMKAIVTVGIPCSGKSTWAEEFCKNSDYLEINRDNVRMELFALERYNDYKFSKHKEQQVTQVTQGLVSTAAAAKTGVVISDTNLNKHHREALHKRLGALGYEVEYKVFNIEFFDALKRNDNRKDKQVPRDVMYRMYRSFMDYQEENGGWTKYAPNDDFPAAYVVDIDGTIATNNSNRGWYDWGRVGEDDPIQTTIDIVNSQYAMGDAIIILSGRDEVCRKETQVWLDKHGVYYDKLYMRPKGSMEKDRYVKHDLFNKYIANEYSVKAVFDDRPQVCLLWHDLGLPLFKVGDPLIEF